MKGWHGNKQRHSLSSRGIKNARGIEYSHHWAGRDYYTWTCDNCGRSMLIQEGEDVACCPCEFEHEFDDEFRCEGIQYRAYNIDWDTDGEDVDLPNEVIFELDDDQDPSIDGANAISDKIGWCVNNFSFIEIKEKNKLLVEKWEELAKVRTDPDISWEERMKRWEEINKRYAKSKGHKKQNDRNNSVFIKHQVKIARKTLKMSDMGAKIMGGMTKEEAREILRKYGDWY